jgi:hypothetical protein
MKKILLILPFIFVAIFFANSVLGTQALIQASFSTNPTTVAPGSDGYLQLTLKNVGTGGAYSINVNEISYDQYITVATSGIGSLGSLGNGETTTYLFKFSVSSLAPSGLYTIRFSINYCYESSCTEINPTAIVSVQAPSALTISSVEPSTLAAGETTTLNFNLANNGGDAINNIVLSWQTPSNEILPLGLSNRQVIPSLNGRSSITIPVNVSVGSSVSPGVYPLTISMQYYDRSGTKQNATSLIGIKIGGTTEFDVGIQTVSAGTTSFSIANIGVNPATSLSVRIPEQQNFAVSGANSVFLGTLNSGDFGIASFQISSRFTTTSTNGKNVGRNITNATTVERSITVEISYSDTSGTRHIVQKEVLLNLGTATPSGNVSRDRGLLYGTTIYIVIALAAAVIVFLVWFFKLRKRKKK